MNWKLLAAVGFTAFAATQIVRKQRDQFSFTGKTVLITGGSRGLGLELARRFAAEGANLVLLARDAEELGRAAADLRDAGALAITVTTDVTNRAAVHSAVQAALAAFGRVDVLVNNAGIMLVGPFDQMTDEDYEQAMDVHFRGPLNMIRAVLPQFRRQGGGRIVNIVSIGGKIAVPHLVPYSASKFALAGLSEGLRSELHRENIFVTSVFPGTMRTGSIYHAQFKGRSEAEFGWFGATASLPLLSLSSARAARKIVAACRRGTPQIVLGLPAKAACLFTALLPNASARAASLANRLLPDSTANGNKARAGSEVQPDLLPAFLMRSSYAAAARNNELG